MLEDFDLKTVSFFGTCLAGAEKTLSSPLISSPYILLAIMAHFALNTNRTLNLSFFISLDPTTPTTGKPTGINILDEYGQVPYITGDDESKIIPNFSSVSESNSFLKVYAINSDTYNHTIDVQIIININKRLLKGEKWVKNTQEIT